MKKYLLVSLVLASSLGWSVGSFAQPVKMEKESCMEQMKEARMARHEMREYNVFSASFVNFSSRFQGASPLSVSINPLNGSFVKCTGECSQLNPNGVLTLFVGTKNPNEMPAADVTFRYRIMNVGCPDGYMYGTVLYHVVSNTYTPIQVFNNTQDIRPNTQWGGLSCSPQ